MAVTARDADAMNEAFVLDPRLAEDSEWVCDLSLSMVRLQKDSRFPWCVLVPRRAGMREILDLTPDDRAQLWREVETVMQGMQARFRPDKMNIAALGNKVAQLHVHVVARFKGDAAWPAPVWGAGAPEAYEAFTIKKLIEDLRADLAALQWFS